MHPLGEKYLRKSALPTLFCPGCGHGTVLNAFLRVIDNLNNFDRLGLVSGIGCSSWVPVFINTDVIHTLHGRALSVATGLKMANPRLTVVAFSGDGDCMGIGGNHLIHAARRNIDITVIMLDNAIYGMTGGQVAPTTPIDARTQTTPYGNPEPPFDVCALVTAAGATHVARYTTAQPRPLVEGIEAALRHKGFSFVQVISQCPTQAGRYIYGMSKTRRIPSYDQGALDQRHGGGKTHPGANRRKDPDRGSPQPRRTTRIRGKPRTHQGGCNGMKDSPKKTKSIEIDPKMCKGCLLCVDQCPGKVLTVSRTRSLKGSVMPEAASIEKCVNCMRCEMICPDLAITVEVAEDEK